MILERFLKSILQITGIVIIVLEEALRDPFQTWVMIVLTILLLTRLFLC